MSMPELILTEFVPLAALTSWRIGGVARYLATVRSPQGVAEAIAFARASAEPDPTTVALHMYADPVNPPEALRPAIPAATVETSWLDAVRDGSSGDRDDLFARGRRHDRVGDAPAQRFAQKRTHGRPIAAHRLQRLRIVAVGDRPDRAAKPRQPCAAFGIAFCHGFGHL